MGYSIRTSAWRYTEWVEWDGVQLRPMWAKLNATELYTHTPTAGHDVNDFDHWENENQAANDPKHTPVMAELSQRLRAHVEANLPPRIAMVATRKINDDEAGRAREAPRSP